MKLHQRAEGLRFLLRQAALALLVAVTVIVGDAEAAVISWNVVNLTAAGTEVSTSGTQVQALNFGRGVSSDFNTTINGVLFTGFANGDATLNTFPSPTLPPFSANSTGVSGDVYTAPPGLTGYDLLLSNQIFSSDLTRNTVTLSNLTSGQAYQVQLFFGDTRTTTTVPLRKPVIDYGLTNEFNGAPTYGTASGNGFVINGTFTADAATQTFTINNVDTSTTPGTLQGFQLNAYQLRAVPEPATIGVLGAAAGLMLALSRGRAAFGRRP